MPITVKAQGKRFTFPDGTTQAQISQAVDEYFGAKPMQGGQDFDVPTEENLALDRQLAQPKPETTLQDKLTGGLETAAALGTGATSGALGMLAGNVVGAIGELTGMTEDGESIGQEWARALTFEPRTPAGQELLQDITEPLSALPAFMGGAPVASANIASQGASQVLRQGQRLKRKGQMAASKKRRAIAEEIKAGNVNTENIVKTLDADGSLIDNPNMKKAIKLLGDDSAAKNAAINFNYMNNETRRNFNRMLDVIESNKKSGRAEDIMVNRPANVIGESLAKRAIRLDKVKQTASRKMEEALSGKVGSKSIDIRVPVRKLLQDIESAGVKVGVDEAGKIVVDTSESLVNFGDVLNDKKLSSLLERVKTGSISGRDAHRLKRQLRENVSYDANKPGATPVSQDAANAIKRFTSSLGDSIGKESTKYKTANQRYSNVIEALQRADKAVGKNLLIGDKLAEQKLGQMAKRIGTNLASKEDVFLMLDELDSALKKEKIPSFNDNIFQQVQALSDLEKIFKVEGEQAPFGFQSRIMQGAADAMSGGQVGVGRELLDATINKFRAMSELEFDEKMKALRKLSEVK